jgi:imidazolonepropionase-like amidohydrolase
MRVEHRLISHKMGIIMRLVLGILSSVLLSLSALAENIIISSVTVLSMDGENILTDATVVISGDRIIHVGDPEGSPRFEYTDHMIDGSGKFLVPGLAEMHGHLPSSSANSTSTKETLFLYLAGGVTTVRGMLGDPIQFEMRDAIKAGTLDGPTLYLAAPSLNGGTVPTAERGAELVRKYHADGYDLLKIHPGISRENYIALADEANRLGIPFGGHVPSDVGLELALQKGQISLDHMDGFLRPATEFSNPVSDDQLADIVGLYKRYEPSWIVPTQALFRLLIAGGDADTLAARAENRYMSPSVRASWARRIRSAGNPNYTHIPENRNKALRALADAGARIVMGSDAPQLYSVPGFSIKREVEELVKAGFSAEEILKIATVNAGSYFADKDDFGTVKVGARADLLLLNGDPREDIMNLFEQAAVIAAGKLYSRKVIDTRLEEIANLNK